MEIERYLSNDLSRHQTPSVTLANPWRLRSPSLPICPNPASGLTNKLVTGLFALYLLSMATLAGAVTLSLEPSASTVKAGDTISLDLMISGLGDYNGDSLGDFDLEVMFDSAIVSFDGYSLAGYLGDPGWFEAIDYSFGEFAPGRVGLTEVSLLSPAELDALQPGSFSLATLDFAVSSLAKGTSTLISVGPVLALGDGYGDPLALEATNDAAISVVPEPLSLVLLGMGLVALGFVNRNSKSIQS